MHFVAAIDAVGGGLRPVLGLHETVCSGAAGAGLRAQWCAGSMPAACRHALELEECAWSSKACATGSPEAQ